MSWNSVQLNNSDQPKTAHFYKTYTLVGLRNYFRSDFQNFPNLNLYDWMIDADPDLIKVEKTGKKILIGAHRDTLV